MIVDQDGAGMWDEEDGFFYDVLQLPGGTAQRLKVRSMVGLLPLCAVTVFDGRLVEKYPEVGASLREFLVSHPELTRAIHDPTRRGQRGRLMASILDESRLRRVLARMLDESEFFSPYGIRSLSRYHLQQPFVFRAGAQEYRVGCAMRMVDARSMAAPRSFKRIRTGATTFSSTNTSTATTERDSA